MVKKIALFCALLGTTAATAYAGNTGWYLGLQAGYAQTDYNGNTVRANFFKNPLGATGTVKQTNDDNGAVGRVNLGYQFNKYLASELGFSYFETMDWTHLYNVGGAKGDIQQEVGDLVIKPILPLSRRFELYAVAGAAYARATSSINSTAKSLGMKDASESAFRPTYGLGAQFYFQQYWSVDLSWRRVTSGSNIEQSTQSMLGIAYHFHDSSDDSDF